MLNLSKKTMPKKLYDFKHYKPYLEFYLRDRGIDVSKNFCCLNPEHEDRTPSMRYWEGDCRVRCFSCGKSYDIYDVLRLMHPDIVNNVKDAYLLAERLYGNTTDGELQES